MAPVLDFSFNLYSAYSVSSVSTSPDSRWALSGSSDCSVCIWDSRTGTLQCTLNGHERAVNATDTSSDGHHLATGAKDGLVRIWRYGLN